MQLRPLDIDALIDRFGAQDAMPTSVLRLCTLMRDPDVDVRRIVDVIELDQSLTAQVLRRANSAAYGGSSPVTTVRDATVRLGSGSILSLAVAASVSGLMRRSQPAYLLAEGELWRRSVAASVAAELVRTRATAPVPVETATAALLHDFGKVVLSRTLPVDHVRELQQIQREADRTREKGKASAESASILLAERRLLGTDHAEVGGRVTARWRLPSSLTSAIARHHEVTAEGTPITMAVSLAHAMVPDLCQDPSAPTTVVDSHGAVMRALGIDPATYPELRVTGIRSFLEVTKAYDV